MCVLSISHPFISSPQSVRFNTTFVPVFRLTSPTFLSLSSTFVSSLLFNTPVTFFSRIRP